MALKTDSALIVTGHFRVWFVIALVSALTAAFILGHASTGSYYYSNGGLLITVLLFAILSFSMIYGMLKNNEKLVWWSGAIEFIILLLPTMAFDIIPSFLPYNLLSIAVIVALPVLWVLLPMGFMAFAKTHDQRIKVFKVFIGVTIATLVSWLLLGKFVSSYSHLSYPDAYLSVSYFSWSTFIFSASLLIAPIAIWMYYLRKLERASKEKKLDKGAVAFIMRNAPEVLLTGVLVIILVFGAAVNTNFRQGCGDYYCDYYSGEDSYSCPMDCYTMCGDGLCNYDEDSYGCPQDCYCGDGWCDYSENHDSCHADCGGYCGDGICEYSEDSSYCPEDCPIPKPPNYVPGEPPNLPPGVENGPPIGEGTLKVYVAGGLNCNELTVALRRDDQALLATQTSTSKVFTFAGVGNNTLYAEVSSSQSSRDQFNSPAITVPEQDTIRVALPDDYCG